MAIKNSKRTGGPRTTEGKLAVSQNALKTAAYSNLAVLPNENPEEFNQLVDQFKHDFHPADVIENSLVHELASLTWKKLRLEKLEQAVFVKKLNAPITMEEFIDCGLRFNKARFDNWVQATTLSNEDMGRLKKTLELIRPLQKVGISEEQLVEVKRLNSRAYEYLVDVYRRIEPMALPDISDCDLVEKTVRFPNEPERFMTSHIFEQFVTSFDATIWCVNNLDKINDAIEQIKQERLLKIMQSGSVLRANDDLSRSVMRTLSEFRKHHEWRIKNRLVDTNEE